ncbi:methyl-accepting chemotaxis protein, partial [Pantoea dispersa]|nr:methyl-accepting chemotaxis protein [Pantoea dispersa]
MRARASAALSVRKIEIGLLDEGATVTKQEQADVASSQRHLTEFIDAGTFKAQGKSLADAFSAAFSAYQKCSMSPM